ncbi:isoprenylcysteine carboxylmethyltransferase family protein [Phycisphaeraceae bacterium D3-23]
MPLIAHALHDPAASAWPDGPVLVVTLCVWWYWSAVVALSWLRRRWTGQRGALRPRAASDRWLMRFWVLVIVAWNALPAIGLHKGAPPFGPFDAAFDVPLVFLRWAAAAGAVGCVVVTVRCWVEMGRDWSVAIVDDGEEQGLVTTGLFGWVRHPIYALSVLMVVLTAVAVMSWPMALVAAAHITMMNLKARREEQALLGVFGDAYRDYMKTTGRFVPRW